MNHLFMLIFSLSFISCSTLKKSLVYPSVGGLVLGGAGGYFLSHEERGYSKPGNAMIYGGIGALLGAGLGYLLYKDHPDQKKLSHMLGVEGKLKAPVVDSYPELDHSVLHGEYKLPVKSSKEIPSSLLGKLKSPTVKIYDIPSKVIDKDGKQIVIEKTKGYEYVLE